MDEATIKASKNIIRAEIGDLISKELEIRFKPLQDAIDTVQKSNDYISNQIKEDRQDINQIKIDISKGTAQNKVIIDNQVHQEDAVVAAVEEATAKIPQHTEKAVEAMFDKQPFLKRIKERFSK